MHVKHLSCRSRDFILTCQEIKEAEGKAVTDVSRN
jgi:hypothetical protein